MAQMIKGNYNALMWLQDELQQSLSRALKAINSYIEGEAADKSLSSCIEELHQIKGSLEMVNMSGAVMLTDAMQQTAIGLRNNNVSDTDAAQDALVRSLLLLPNYLKLLGDDFQDHPLSLLESINELRLAYGADMVSERDMFKVVMTVALPDSITPNPHRKLPAISIEKTKLGHAFQVMLLNWLRQQDKKSLQKMRSMLHFLRLSCQQEKTTLFWWSAETLIEALEQDGLTVSHEVKQLLGKLVAPIKTQSEQDESALLNALPTELVTSLLLLIAKTDSHGPHVTLLKTTFNLHFYDNKPKIYGMSNNALGDAHMALLEQLQELKEQINEYTRDKDLNTGTLNEVIAQLQSMTDTLALLSEYEASNLLHHQAERFHALIESGETPDDETLTELADVLLKVEIFLQSSTQENVSEQLRDTVINECLLEMANVKESLTLMSQSGRYPDGLGDSEEQLKLIAGSMNMLNYPEATEVIELTADKMAEQTVSNEAFTPAKLNRIADVLAYCEMYMEGIKQHGHEETRYLADAKEKLTSYDSADDVAETMIDVAEPGPDSMSDASTAETSEELEQDQTLAELDSLLGSDQGPLLLETAPTEAEQTETGSVAEEMAEVSDNESVLTPATSSEDTTMPAEEDWQFAEGIDDEIAAIFIEEANEVLAELDTLMPQWLNDNDQTALADIRRYFHTLKGSGRMAGASVIGELAWAVEQVLNHVLDGTRPDSPSVKALATRSQQHIPTLLARFTQANNDATAEVDALLALKAQCLETGSNLNVSEEAAPVTAPVTDAEMPATEPVVDDELEFDLSLYTDESEHIIELEDADVETERFNVDADALTSVEKYIRNQSENKLSDVTSDSTVERAQLTGVEAYIQTMANETGVSRYLRLQRQQQNVAAQAKVKEEIIRPLTFTSVDRYIVNKARQERPSTSVDQYIAAKADTSEPSLAVSGDDSDVLSEEDELQQIFISEARQHIASLQQNFKDIVFSRQVNKPLLRAVHSLKGCANVAGIMPMALIATDMDQAMKRLHAQDVVLDNEQMDLLEKSIDGLDQILMSLTDNQDEPDIGKLSDIVAQLTPPLQETSDTAPVIDPEFLVVLLEETDELLDNYTNQLSHWQQQPDDRENLQALNSTLGKLKETALQAEQSVIADLYDSLNQMIQHCQPHEAGLKTLLNQGYEQLNEHIESLLQNKALSAEKDFPGQVRQFLSQRNDAVDLMHDDLSIGESHIETMLDLDETEFAIPSDLDSELLEAFSEEAEELLASSGQAIKDWHLTRDKERYSLQLQRDLHTLKGGARLAGITPIGDLTHQTETLVLAVSDDKREADEDFFDLLQRCQDKLSEMQEQLKAQTSITTAVSLIAEITLLIAGEDLDVDDRSQSDAVHKDDSVALLQPESALDVDETDFAIPSDLDSELLEAFTEEAEELLASSGQEIKDWLARPQQDHDSLQLQRDLHTLKGGARLAGILPIGDLTHQTETLVLAVSDDKLDANEDFFDLLQRCQDKLTEMQEQLKSRSPITTAFSLISEISILTAGENIDVDDRLLEEHGKPDAEVKTESPVLPEIERVVAKTAPAHVEQVRVRADLLDYLTNFAGEVSISRDRVTQQHNAMRTQLHEMEETVARLHDQLRNLEIETETQILFRYEDEKHKHDSEFDPLELDRFSMIQQLSRGLTESVIDLNDITHSMDVLVKETDTILLQQSRLNTDLQEGLMNTRLLPFTGVVPRLERIVRQTSAELGKKADLLIQGAELELDRTILDRIVAPVEHILRNAIAHGIEDPDARLQEGKLQDGQLSLHIEREGSEIVLTVSDDGHGIDVDKIRDKALSLNLISPDAIPPEDELIQLILTSGFSTADNISQVAGRGVGMDVVNNEIRNLKGRLNIQSIKGEGTTFVIRLPLTLSVIQALLVRVHNEQYAIPLASVNAGERISVRDIKLMIGTHNPQYEFNGEKYDFMPLSSLLDKPLSLPDNLKHQLPLLLFRSGDMRIALLVDAIVSNREIVIKAVGHQLSRITAVNGATILGDGRVVFILDVPTLISTNRNNIRLDNSHAINLERELEHLQERAPIAMVVDDSITMRKASGNLLKRLGFDVQTARDGVDALSQLHEQKPDIILLDVEMPRMDGFEFASIVRNDPTFHHLPIIMITSRTGAKHRERAMGIGVNAYMGKPYQEDELVATMKRLLGNSSFQQQES
ncbi:Hpt domain-containing protein [Methylophaga sp.]|uniref:hybrid sensor histidine kinase/response regulator n=1 Tax=Methylophaga sp. TaxID=2024840 RepID=UPI003F69C024